MQNEIAPENFLNQYEKWFEKREKGSEKRSEMCLKILKPLSRRLKMYAVLPGKRSSESVQIVKHNTSISSAIALPARKGPLGNLDSWDIWA